MKNNNTNNETVLDQAFDDCLEMMQKQGMTPAECLAKYPEIQKDLEPALKAALQMRAGANVAPDTIYRARVKERLVTERAPGTHRGFVPGRFVYRLTAATVGFAMVLGGVGYASTDSLPDDPLYPVKQLIEQIRLAVTTENQAEIELRLKLAEERMGEAEAMAEQGKTDEARQALNDLNKEMRAVYKLADMVPGQNREILLAKFAIISQRHVMVLEGVLARVPDSAKPAIERAIEKAQNGSDQASESVMKMEREREEERERERENELNEEEKKNRNEEREREAEEDADGSGNQNTNINSNSSGGQGQGTDPSSGQNNTNSNQNVNGNKNKN